MQAEKTVVILSSNPHGGKHVVEHPPFPEGANLSVENGHVEGPLTAGLMDGHEEILDFQIVQLEVARLARMPEVGGDKRFRSVPVDVSSI
jgi:hypothetical protein